MTKKMKIIFTLSLLGNVLLLGVVGGTAYRIKQATQPWKEVRKEISPESRELIKDTFKSKKQDIRGMFQEARVKKKALEDAFTAEEFDPDAFSAAARELQQLGNRMVAHKFETFQELGHMLPQHERKALSKRLVSSLFSKQGMHKNKKKKTDRAGQQTDRQQRQLKQHGKDRDRPLSRD